MQARNKATRRKKRLGMVVLVTAVSLAFIIPMVGLALDASMLYAIKAKLSAAADAASLASARSLNVGLTLTEQEASARATALRFFQANFPTGHFNTSNPQVQVDIAETAFRTRTVTTTASVDAPSYFMRILGFNSTTVRAEGKASRRDVNLIVVLDRSSSMAASGSCQPMKDAATAFVGQFANHRDRLGLIVFGINTILAFPPAQNFKTASPLPLADRIAQVTCDTNTSSAQALWLAYQELATINEPGALNVILFFTDGLPNGLHASYPVKTQTDGRYGYASPYPGTGTNYSSMVPSTCTFRDTFGFDQSYNRNPRTGTNYSSSPWNPAWTPGNKVGVISQKGGFASTGATAGVFQPVVPPPTGSSMPSLAESIIADNAGCAFASGGGNVRRDIAYLPSQDIYGNSTTCCYKAIDTFTSGPYSGQIRPDKPSSIGSASFNAADSAATRIRNSALGVIIYTIGLGGSGGESPDEVFMRRVSNDPSSPIYDATRPPGLYAFAPDNTQLAQAFYQIASEILRLAR